MLVLPAYIEQIRNTIQIDRTLTPQLPNFGLYNDGGGRVKSKKEGFVMNNRLRFTALLSVTVLITGFAVSTVKAQDGFNRAAASSAITSFYESSGEWAGAFHITSITQMVPIPEGGGRWVVHVRYNFVGYGVDHTGANRRGETGWDQRTFNLETSGSRYTVTGMGDHMSADMSAVSGDQTGGNTSAGDQSKSIETRPVYPSRVPANVAQSGTPQTARSTQERNVQPESNSDEIARRHHHQQQEEADKAAGAACAVCGGGIVTIIGTLVVLFILNIALLVWVARDAKSRGMDSSILWMFLVMFTSVIGLVIYLFARPQGELIQCAHCRGKRLKVGAICPHCQHA